MANPVQQRAQAALGNLVGLEVLATFWAGDMTCFVFGRRTSETKPIEWALHILLGWRLELRGRPIAGIYDLFEPVGPASSRDDWKPSQGHSLLEHILRELFCDPLGPDEKIREIVNRADGFLVTAAEVSPGGDCFVQFANEYRIQILPLSGRGEAWVVFPQGRSEAGFSLYLEDLPDDPTAELKSPARA